MSRIPHTTLSDEELLERHLQNGDKEALAVLLQRYTMMLLGVAMKYLKDRHLAEDAVQHIFLKSFTHLPKTEIQNFKGWLYIILRNHCLQQLRNQPHRTSEAQLQNIKAEEIHENILEKEITLTQMHEALGELNEEQQTSVRLFYLEKKSYQQIMEQTGFNFMQVKSFIQNGKRNLKNMLLKKMKDKLQ